MNIVAAAFCLPTVVFSGVGMGDAKRYERYSNDDYNGKPNISLLKDSN